MIEYEAFSQYDVFSRLALPFPPESISWRVGPTNKRNHKEGGERKGQPLCYIDSRDVQDRLDTILGPENWQDEYINAGNGSTCCRIGIRVGDDWIWKSDGAGATDMEGDKGQFSDAFKRAAVKFGIGRYLYDVKSEWIALDDYWRIPKDAKPKLNEALKRVSDNIEWGSRDARNIYRVLVSVLKDFSISADHIDEFISKNQGVIAQLPVRLRGNLETEAARIRETFSTQTEAAE